LATPPGGRQQIPPPICATAMPDISCHLMRHLIITISTFFPTLSFGQVQNIIGTYSSIIPKVEVKFNSDSTFEYTTNEQHPTFYRWEPFSEKGHWTVSGDTIILNPQLSKRLFVESDFKEGEVKGDTMILLTVHHIKRYFDINGNITNADTVQIDRLDYCFNELKKKKLTRVTPRPTVKCAFAGYIPKEIITTNHTISIQRPTENIKSIFIGCYELQGMKEFIINDPNSNRFTFNVYSNYYQDGQLRQMKFLIKNQKVLYTRQKGNGDFEKDNFWFDTGFKLKKEKDGS